MTKRVREILSWYGSDNPGVLSNLARLMGSGRLAGTGKFVILPVDQGFEHGPARSFAPNSSGYDPRYHFELALAAGCNAYAAPLGFLEAGAADFAGQIPLILKLNNSDSLTGGADPCPAITGSVDEALRLGCAAIGFTIYPASAARNEMYGQIRALTEEAKRKGLAVVVWSYPRGSGISKQGETAIDVVSYAAQIACQLGAHVVKVKPPTAHLEQDAAKKVYEKQNIPIGTLADRIRHVVQSAFAGRRIVIFSGGEAKGTKDILDEVRAIHAGGGFGSIIGRNSFQRERGEAHDFLRQVMDVYAGAAPRKPAACLATQRRRNTPRRTHVPTPTAWRARRGPIRTTTSRCTPSSPSKKPVGTPQAYRDRGRPPSYLEPVKTGDTSHWEVFLVAPCEADRSFLSYLNLLGDRSRTFAILGGEADSNCERRPLRPRPCQAYRERARGTRVRPHTEAVRLPRGRKVPDVDHGRIVALWKALNTSARRLLTDESTRATSGSASLLAILFLTTVLAYIFAVPKAVEAIKALGYGAHAVGRAARLAAWALAIGHGLAFMLKAGH